jgi:hypothetical protein
LLCRNIDTNNPLLLVQFITAWLVALKERELAALLHPQPFAPGLIPVTAALGLWWAGQVMGINLLAPAGAVGALQAALKLFASPGRLVLTSAASVQHDTIRYALR